MGKRPFLVAVLIALSTSGAANAGPIESQETIGYPSVAAALKALKHKPDAKVREQDGWTYVDDASASTKWTFVPASHAAYPAVAKQSLRNKDGHIWVDLDIECEAAKEPCDKFAEDFHQFTDLLSQRMSNELKQKPKR